jgi:copper chaperone NosL
MKKLTKITIISISVLMIAAFFLPTWDISLEAPQYPEGLGMQIWLSKITGDLNTINGLNHYIGMKKIEPDSIKELTIMPYLLGFLILTGIIVGALGKRKLLVLWVILFVLLGIAGGIDFYMWEYDYGHDLDPTAAIVIPGMSYQPPLIGSQQLLNFVAHSYPAEGGMILIISGIISVLALGYEIIFNKTQKKKINEKHKVKFSAAAGSILHTKLVQ